MGVTTDTASPDTPAAGARPALLLRHKKQKLGRIVLDQPRITLGRSPKCDVVLDVTSGISREHAHVLVIDDEVVIEDLGSRNGTYVNNKICDRRTLRAGDRISIGQYRLHFIPKPESRRQAARRATGRPDVAKLIGLWGSAAVTADNDCCPLCDRPLRYDEEGPAAAPGTGGSSDDASAIEALEPGPVAPQSAVQRDAPGIVAASTSTADEDDSIMRRVMASIENIPIAVNDSTGPATVETTGLSPRLKCKLKRSVALPGRVPLVSKNLRRKLKPAEPEVRCRRSRLARLANRVRW